MLLELFQEHDNQVNLPKDEDLSKLSKLIPLTPMVFKYYLETGRNFSHNRTIKYVINGNKIGSIA